jgi:hypothetical protein
MRLPREMAGASEIQRSRAALAPPLADTLAVPTLNIKRLGTEPSTVVLRPPMTLAVLISGRVNTC